MVRVPRGRPITVVGLAIGLLALVVLVIVVAVAPPKTVVERAPDACRATVSNVGGLLWRPASCPAPGYPNLAIPDDPVLDPAETQRIRTLPGALVNIHDYAEPIYYPGRGTPKRKVVCVQYRCVGGDKAPLTGKEIVAEGTDGQLIIIDLRRRRTYELYHVARDPDGTVQLGADGSVRVASMSVADLDGRGNETAQGQGLNITGAGVSRAFGVIRAPEVRAAAIDPAHAIKHALQASLPMGTNCASTFREPATKSDGRAPGGDCVQEGARMQLDPAYDCTEVSTELGQAICHALQKYGAYVVDNTGSDLMGFYGQHDDSWSSGTADYRVAGITGDYQDLGLPMDRLRVLAHWSGR